MVKEWIINNFLISRTNEIIFSVNSSITILTPVTVLTDMFGVVIQNALENGIDPILAMKDSDPDNLLGFNDYLYTSEGLSVL